MFVAVVVEWLSWFGDVGDRGYVCFVVGGHVCGGGAAGVCRGG